MTKHEQTILTGARNAWPHAVAVDAAGLRRVADSLVRKKMLHKAKFKDGKLGYQITDAGRAALEKPGADAYEREVQAAMKLLRESVTPHIKKPPTRR